jgi:hypothetical protein
MNQHSNKIIGGIAALVVILALWGLTRREIYYSTHEAGAGRVNGFKERAARYKNNDFQKMFFEDVTPPPLGGHISVGTRGPFFMMVKIDRGEGLDNSDPRYPGDRDEIQFTVTQGKGAVKPMTSGKNIWDNLTLFQKTYTCTVDEKGQVTAVFYPSVFCFESEYAITAVVLNNSKLTNEIRFYWRPYPLDEDDFRKTSQKYVEWYNKTRLINRTAQVYVNTWNEGATVMGEEDSTPVPTATPGLLVVRNGSSAYQGESETNPEMTPDSLEREMKWRPWGYSDANVIFISRDEDESYHFWFYEEDGGVLREKITIPSLSRIDSSESDMEYKNINGTLFQSSQVDMVYSGKILTQKTESKIVVTLSP